jgi:hypothetical protein
MFLDILVDRIAINIGNEPCAFEYILRGTQSLSHSRNSQDIMESELQEDPPLLRHCDKQMHGVYLQIGR